MLSHSILGRFGVLEWKLLELHILECSHNCCHPVFLCKPVKLHECRNKGAFFIIINWHSFVLKGWQNGKRGGKKKQLSHCQTRDAATHREFVLLNVGSEMEPGRSGRDLGLFLCCTGIIQRQHAFWHCQRVGNWPWGAVWHCGLPEEETGPLSWLGPLCPALLPRP